MQAFWDLTFGDLDAMDLHGRQAALFGTGDQLTYGDTFQDAIGILADKLEERGAILRGAWPVEGYEHTASLAQRGDRFVGLALDLDNQADLHEARIERWVDQLVDEFGLATGGAGAARIVTRGRLRVD